MGSGALLSQCFFQCPIPQFFIAPLFNPAMADQEVHAIDSEHSKNRPDPQQQMWRVLQTLASKDSPVNHFGTGNIDTLGTLPKKNGVNITSELKKWHKKHYDAARTHVVVVSNQPVGVLQAMAADHFQGVPNNGIGKRPYEEKPQTAYPKASTSQVVTLTTTSAETRLWVQFPLDSLRSRYRSKATSYVVFMLGHGGPNGLAAQLRAEDLAVGVDPSVDTERELSQMLIGMSLTEKGKGNIKKIKEKLFSYINV